MRVFLTMNCLFASYFLLVLTVGQMEAWSADLGDAAATAPTASAAQDVVEHFLNASAIAGDLVELRDLVAALFDMERMSKAIVGRLTWGTWSETEQSAFSDRMTMLTASMILSRRNRASADASIAKPIILETRAGPLDAKIVSTEAQLEGEPMRVDYQVRESDGSWKIVDIVADARISEVARRKAEFASIIQTNGHAAIIEALDRKIKELGEAEN